MPEFRFKCFGGRGPLCQISRIEDGLRALGCQEGMGGDPNVDLIYANDEPRWQEAIDYRDTFAKNAKVILCILDIPEISYPNFNPYEWLPKLKRADSLVSISGWVQSQMTRILSLSSDVIFQPIKDINPVQRIAGTKSFPYRVLLDGRLKDKGKRVDLAIQSLILAGFNEEEVAVVGGEYPGYGTNLGVVSDNILNDLYNSVDFVMMTSIFEGLGLQGLQALAGGAIPIICHDLPTAHEGFYHPHWMCFPHPHAIAYRLRSLIDNPAWLTAEKIEALRIGGEVREIFSGKAVAQRILNVYNKLNGTNPTT